MTHRFVRTFGNIGKREADGGGGMNDEAATPEYGAVVASFHSSRKNGFVTLDDVSDCSGRESCGRY